MPDIGDYAVIGDGRSAALVSRTGSIDWLCWPRFDSPSIFGRLLGDRAGHWSIRPAGRFTSERSYISGTNVLRTRFSCAGGTAVLTDFMPVRDGGLAPEHEVIRLAECESGEVELESDYRPVPGYGRETVGPRGRTSQGLLTLRGPARLKLRAGARAAWALTLECGWPGVMVPVERWGPAMLDRTADWWRRWSSSLRYDGPDRAAVIRSALALRLLLHAPSGAIIAAPTTSLPERLGGDLNWDYRYCWLRDASLTVRALRGLSCGGEARAFVDWLLHSTRMTRPELRVLYDVYGNSPPRETVLDHLDGFQGSRPVRLGNAAAGQLQLDIYGEVIGAAAQLVEAEESADRDTRRLLVELGSYVLENWRRPDDGIWEQRTRRAPRTHSRALCWSALNVLLRLHEKGLLPKAPAGELRAGREAIRRSIEEECWDEELGSYVAVPGSKEADASLLMLAWHGFEPASSPRMRGTYARIVERLGAGDGLLYRYHGPDTAGEGAFGVCSFWAADFLASGGGSAAEARAAFERLLPYANDVGLYAEEIDPATKRPLGNFPQAFTHVGLIDAALSVERVS